MTGNVKCCGHSPVTGLLDPVNAANSDDDNNNKNKNINNNNKNINNNK